MPYSTALQRHIDVPVEYLNNVDEWETLCAIADLGPDSTAAQIRAAAARGDINARHVVAAAAAGNQDAKQWLAE
jgi:predicted NBD/HSP70 family sugar kinase